jgi:serine/threonine protein kinase
MQELFNEAPARLDVSAEYTDRLAELVPPSWLVECDGVWAHARCTGGDTLTTAPVPQGFKIHVAGVPHQALRILDLVVPLCVEAQIDFKIAADPARLLQLNSKRHPRGASGKFMTIYPVGVDRFTDLIEELYQRTKDEDVAGPRILSDRQYKDSSLLYYRYGGFVSPRRVTVRGTRDLFLVSPSGELVSDQRLPYYHLPDWVADPFEDAVLRDRYRVDNAITFSNSGGIYAGTDIVDGRQILLKEARPLTNYWTAGDEYLDAVRLLRQEYQMLCRLDGLGCVPEAIDLFEECGHTFLVEERISGLSLREYWALNDVILTPYIRRPGRIEAWLPRFKRIAEGLIEQVAAVHTRDVVLGDLSPGNVLVDPDTLGIRLIDMESAVSPTDEPELIRYATRWGTPGFVHPERSGRDRPLVSDDLYALAMVLSAGAVPVHPLVALKPDVVQFFLDRFVGLGLAVEVREIVNALLRGSLDEAREILAGWDLGAATSGADARAW